MRTGSRDPRSARDYVATSRTMMLVTGGAAVAGGLLLAPVLAHGNPGLADAYRIARSAQCARLRRHLTDDDAGHRRGGRGGWPPASAGPCARESRAGRCVPDRAIRAVRAITSPPHGR